MATVEARPSTTNTLTLQLIELREQGLDVVDAWVGIDRGNWEMPQILQALNNAGFDVPKLISNLKGNTLIRDSSM